jgi:hypothetical protein
LHELGACAESIGVGPTVTLTGLGAHTITLIVNDGIEDSLPDEVIITLVDLGVPEITCPGDMVTEATVKLKVDDRTEHIVGEGDGPANALDAALRKSLENFYPSIKEVHLIDYKVRVVNARAGTAARVRVIIESRDKNSIWGTVGVSENIIEASWQALVDSVEYKLQKDAK